MMNLSEYRTRPETLADYLPWVALVAPGIVLNKDGSLQRSARFRGPDLESATPAELMAVAARLNNALRRLGSGWAIFFEAERHMATGYPQSTFPDPVSWLVDEERRAAFQEEGTHYESVYHVTFAFLPRGERTSRAERMLLEMPEDGRDLDYRDVLDGFVARTDRVLDLLSGFMPEVEPLDDAATLTFLHTAISTKRHPVAVPEIPFFLDGLLADMPMVGGLEPMLGEHHLRTVSVRGFPGMTWPGLLDDLNHLAIDYRWSTRFVALDRPEATNELVKWRRQWFAKRKGVVALLRETIFQQESPLVDTDAENKALDADAALQELGADDVAFGYLTTTITVWDRDRRAVDERIKAVESIVNGRGFVTILETLNAVDAWLGSLPGHCYANVRQPIVSTLNLAHMVPMSAVWAGPVRNDHLDGPPLIVTRTTGATPFRLSTHAGDVGHSLIVGPTGAGKSVLLSLMALQWRRYRQAQIFLFDKGASCRAAVLGMGGEFDDLGAEDGIAFQPLTDIEREPERAWAAEWIAGLIAHEKVDVTPEVKEAVWSALTSLASAPREERTITGLSVLLQSNTLKQALQPYTLDGPFGRLLDADADRLGSASVQCFEMEELMHTPSLVLPVLTYLFHRLEARFDGKPTMLVLDEAWVFLDNPLFAGRIREWLKTLRKKNVAVVFATQSLSDIAGSSIAPALIESCPTRIFLPNERAIEPQEQAIYRAFGLNDRQVELIARSTPKRDYYVQTARGNRLFELGLGPITLAFCGTSDKPSQALIAQTLEADGRQNFAAAFLRANDLAWAADLTGQHDPNPQTEDSP